MDPALKPAPPSPSKYKLDPVIVSYIWRAAFFLAILSLLLVVSGFYFEDQLMSAAQFVADKLGFIGLCLIVLVADSLVTPLPPDAVLLVIAKSALREYWFFYVSILGVFSTFAGMIGWLIGRWLGHFRWAKKIFGELSEDNRQFVRKHGAWAVVVGALTPIPFSVTCWAAGLLKMDWRYVLLAATLRIPRFLAFYVLIYYSVTFSSFFRI